MGWWSHCWMRMGSGNSQALGCCSGKRGRAGYPGLHGSGQKLSTKTGFIPFGSIFPVLSPSLTSSWANVGSGFPSVCFMSATETLEFCPAFYYFSVQISTSEPTGIPNHSCSRIVFFTFGAGLEEKVWRFSHRPRE